MTIDEANGPLTVTNVTSNNGTVALNVTGGGLTLGTVNAGTTVTLNADGAITDAGGTTPSVVAMQLTIASAGSAILVTNRHARREQCCWLADRGR